MVKDDQKSPDDQPRGQGSAAGPWGKLRSLPVLAVAGLAAAGLLVGGLLFTGCAPTPGPKGAPRLFYGWPTDRKPDVVLLLSGQQHGYLEPCGCSSPQYGGLPRRYNFLQTLVKDRGWPVVPIDLGDVAQRSGAQTLIKYMYSMKALLAMGYAAVGIGEFEMRMPLSVPLGEWALNNPQPPIVMSNLLNAEEKFPGQTKPYVIAGGTNDVPKVGIVSVIGPSVSHEVQDPDVRFAANNKAIPAVLNGEKFQQEKPELLVLLYQGSLKEAKSCARQFPQFHVVLCLTEEEEPSGKPEKVGDALVIGVGHKGRYVGAVGAYRTGNAAQPFDLHYQLVQMGPEYQTPAGKEAGNPVQELLEKYAQEIKQGNYLERFPKTKHPVQLEFPEATYVGSKRCQSCHEKAYDTWKNSPHADAYDKLVSAKHPSLRQYDGECVSCHVTGFNYQGGFATEEKTPHLKDNGCENCHGPGSVHVKGNKSEKLMALMNPFKTPEKETEEAKQARINRLDSRCQECHDINNDVNWSHVPFLEKWAKIAHPEPKDR